jgi:N-methylhydantoinase A
VRLGVDTGGTFTDFVWLDADGRLQIHKELSTPTDPSQAILQGVAVLAVPPTAVVIHGSTVATNALLERRGARTALITTAGFADVLEIGRQNRPDIYALAPQKPAPFVPRNWRFELDERVTAQGDVLRPLPLAALETIAQTLAAAQIESVAVCFLFSFLHPQHEQQVAEWLRNSAFGRAGGHISLSSEILPEYREYERTATTVINAYVAPLMSRYLLRLAQGLGQRPLHIMQSNGGIINAQMAGAQAARTALSGPAGGVVGARYVAAAADEHNIITFDMGGTSTDVALCPHALPTTTHGAIAGFPLRLPIIDIHTVGAGGGSLAAVDAGGALHVGPQSAGAYPGPACYGRVPISPDNPIRATVTDANVVLGRLDAAHFLGGAMALDVAAAHEALRLLAQQMNADSPETAAWGVLQVANAHMERAIRHISVERGFDPRLFTLVPFGGAGALHACEMAENLQIPRIFIPPTPGVLSALGMLVAAPTKDYAQTVMMGALGPDLPDVLASCFAPLEARATEEMAAEGHEQLQWAYVLDMRYRGQSHELRIAYAPTMGVEGVRAAFDAAHQGRFGYAQPGEPVEIVTIRLTAVAPITPPPLPQFPPANTDLAVAYVGEKPVWFAQQPMLTRLYDRHKLQAGHVVAGPAVLFQYDTTIVIPPGWQTAVDNYHNLLLTRV